MRPKITFWRFCILAIFRCHDLRRSEWISTFQNKRIHCPTMFLLDLHAFVHQNCRDVSPSPCGLGLALRSVNSGLGLVSLGHGLCFGLSHRRFDFACTRFTFLFQTGMNRPRSSILSTLQYTIFWYE